MRISLLLLVAATAVILASCSHDMPREPEQRAGPAKQDDPWRVQGSVTAGPMSGTPQGPYGARP